MRICSMILGLALAASAWAAEEIAVPEELRLAL